MSFVDLTEDDESDFLVHEYVQTQALREVSSIRSPWQELRILWQRDYKPRNSKLDVSPQDLDNWIWLDSYDLKRHSITLTVQADVELRGEIFLRICNILMKPDTSEIFLAGHVFLRNGQAWSEDTKSILAYKDEEMSHFLIENENEVHLSVNILADSDYGHEHQALRIFPIDAFVRLREIWITNQQFPSLNRNYAEGHVPRLSRDTDPLICRWLTTKIWRSSKSLNNQTTSHCWRRIARVRESSADPKYAISDQELLHQFRQTVTKGGGSRGIHQKEAAQRAYQRHILRQAQTLRAGSGSAPIVLDDEDPRNGSGRPIPSQDCSDIEADEPLENLFLEINDDATCSPVENTSQSDTFWTQTHEQASPRKGHNVQRYQVGDIFAGCGGFAAAATASGFEIKFAVDMQPEMCATYQYNNPAVRVACTDAARFIQAYVFDETVDVLHFSFPCQPFSKAHTVPGRNDNANRETLGTLERYLMICKPRVVTIEEADALGTFIKHSQELKRIILQFTMSGFSVDARILNLADYGICQKRQRLVIIASCPGQRLPEFPQPTHMDPKLRCNLGPSDLPLPRWVGPRTVLSSLPRKWRHHDPSDPKLAVTGNQSSPDGLVPTLVTYNRLTHFEGKRLYTIMEKLLIQGFPLHFEFPDGQTQSCMEKQIGNAVPPKAFEVILTQIRNELLKDDGMLSA